MRKNETAPRYLESGSDEDTPGSPGLEVRSRPWGSGGAGASLNMAARRKPGADLMENAGSGRTL